MGCSSSISRQLQDKQREIKSKPVDIPLSKAQKYLLRETWETIEIHKKTIGKKTFLRFFEYDPDFQKLFPEFKGLTYEELEKANVLHGHAKRVMKALENAITALDDVVSFSAYLQELGRRHKARALKPSYLDLFGVLNCGTVLSTMTEKRLGTKYIPEPEIYRLS